MEFDISLERKNRRSQVSFYILGESGPGSRRYIILQKKYKDFKTHHVAIYGDKVF